MLNSYLVQLENSWKSWSALILSQLRARGAPEQLCNFKASLNYVIHGCPSRIPLLAARPLALMCFIVPARSSRAPSAEGNAYTTFMPGGVSPCWGEFLSAPFREFSGWFSVRDYEAAGNLYVLNWRFWKPYSYLLASVWSLSMIFVMCCHVGAWSLGCELVPYSPEGNSSYQHNAGK